ncbi:hypothetical protein DOTSEDRAFT_70075 [Dothistroma septosporum NZE10]|uniref:Uncharacterized protein n=1 Tax=Dothistroma septosporum (strain NZE10 / CBS 128990) TaxID=675120 RepID=N1PU48_DOTSN|nr:hypothetical protein DOTSEDRAFT_70075 [Dothistroma septosporum NZE10]
MAACRSAGCCVYNSACRPRNKIFCGLVISSPHCCRQSLSFSNTAIMKLTQAAVPAFFAASAYAQANATGVLGVGPYANESLFRNANQAASKSVPFSLYYPSSDNAQAPVWTWTVNLNTATVPDSDIPNAQALNTEYVFSWPDGGSIQDAAAANAGHTSTNHFCVTVVDSLFPQDGTNDYDDDKEKDPDDFTHGSCTSALRLRCVNAIVDRWRNTQPDASGCRGGNVDLDHIRQCEWVIDGYYGQTYDLLAKQTAAANGTFPLQSGRGFAHVTTETYNGDNQIYINQEKGRLQMVVIDSGNVLTPLCMRVDASEHATGQSTGATEQGAASSAGMNGWLLAASAATVVAFYL